MIKILQYGLTNHLGGIETYLLKLATKIDKTKYKLDFLILGKNLPCFYDELLELGCGFHFVTDRSENPIKNYSEISAVVKNGNYNLIHCHLNSLSYITPVIIGVKNNLPTLVHSRNAGITSSPISKVLHSINKLRLPKDRINMAAVSNIAGKWMFGKNSSVIVINNGIETEKYRFSSVARNIIRNEFNIQDESLIIHTGAFREQKNHEFLIDIFYEATKIKNDLKLMLVGTGPLESSIRDKSRELKIEDKIIFTGNRNDIPSLLSSADVFLFPSFYEGFPNSVIEAETAGLSCILSNTITDEVVIFESCKKMDLTESAESWAVQLIELIDNPKERGEAHAEVNKLGYSVEEEIRRIEKVYLNMIKKS